MIDWTRVKGFDWEAGNARKNADKHGVTQSEAEQVLFGQPLLIATDARHSEREPRWHALGQTLDQRFLHVTFNLREQGSLIRVRSTRPMHRKERQDYAKAQQAPTRIQDRSRGAGFLGIA